MDKYYVTYKCTLCGQLMVYGGAKEVPYDSLPELCYRVVQNQMFMGNQDLYQAPMQMPHKCKDGGCGMAYFAGFKKA